MRQTVVQYYAAPTTAVSPDYEVTTMHAVCRPILSCFCLLLAFSAPAMANPQELVIEELSYLDRSYMARQRDTLGDLAARNLGRHFQGSRDNDLAILQALLDRRLVRNDQVEELQAMGIIMGDLLADELDMDWVIYKDKVGRTRALRFGETDTYLFPNTMVSRRRTVGNMDSIADIYQKAYDSVAPLQTPSRFR